MSQQKTTKMSTRKGNVVLMDDVIARATGEVILRQIETDEVKRDHWILMIGNFFNTLSEASKKGTDTVTFKISDYLE